MAYTAVRIPSGRMRANDGENGKCQSVLLVLQSSVADTKQYQHSVPTGILDW
jgi:hypothetical protein